MSFLLGALPSGNGERTPYNGLTSIGALRCKWFCLWWWTHIPLHKRLIVVSHDSLILGLLKSALYYFLTDIQSHTTSTSPW